MTPSKVARSVDGRTILNEQTDEAFEALLRYMRDSRGFDFTGYKRTSLMRRVRHRMDAAGYETFEEYLDLLQASSDEFAALFNTILINGSPSAGRPTPSGSGVPDAHPAKRRTPWR